MKIYQRLQMVTNGYKQIYIVFKKVMYYIRELKMGDSIYAK